MLIAASLGGSGLAFMNKLACWDGAWNSYTTQFQAHCYTDIYPLYFTEKLDVGQVPYFGHPVEYPVLIGAVMQFAAWLVHGVANPSAAGKDFFDVTIVIITLFSIVATLAAARLAGPSRRWTALGVALAPALVLSAFINWDMVAMALATLGMAAWAARRHVLAGVLLGLAVATKFYPLLFFWPLLLLCIRAGRLRAFVVTALSAVAAWLVVDVPVMVGATDGWLRFYQMNETRAADWGSVWYFFEVERWGVLSTLDVHALNLWSAAIVVLGCLAAAALVLLAPRRPRVPQVCFLVLAVFLLANKVWSPQYVIWLVPLVVLARPRLWSFALWQTAEAGYFFAIWAYLITVFNPALPPPKTAAEGGITAAVYFVALLARFGSVVLLCALVTWDILRPDRDVVRAAGEDDPAGGVLSDAEDRWSWRVSLRTDVPVTPQ